MITNWGAHHVDIAQWAMGQELGGPRTIEAHAEFMNNDAWTVHTTYHVEMLYPGNVQCDPRPPVSRPASGSRATRAGSFAPGGRKIPSYRTPCRHCRCARATKDSLAAHRRRCSLDAQQIASRQLAGKHRRQPPAHRAHPAIRPQPRSLRRRVDWHEIEAQTDVGRRHGSLRRRRLPRTPCAAARRANPSTILRRHCFRRAWPEFFPFQPPGFD